MCFKRLSVSSEIVKNIEKSSISGDLGEFSGGTNRGVLIGFGKKQNMFHNQYIQEHLFRGVAFRKLINRKITPPSSYRPLCSLSKDLFGDHANFSIDLFSHDLKIKHKVQLFLQVIKTVSPKMFKKTFFFSPIQLLTYSKIA